MLNNLAVPGSSPDQILNKRPELSSGLTLMIVPVIIFWIPHGAIYIYTPVQVWSTQLVQLKILRRDLDERE